MALSLKLVPVHLENMKMQFQMLMHLELHFYITHPTQVLVMH